MHKARLAWEKPHPRPGEMPLDDPAQRRLFVGCSGWYYRDWEGIFYPPKKSSSKWFDVYAELRIWADRIQRSGAERVWAYFNNDREGHAIANARTLRQQLDPLGRRGGVDDGA